MNITPEGLDLNKRYTPQELHDLGIDECTIRTACEELSVGGIRVNGSLLGAVVANVIFRKSPGDGNGGNVNAYVLAEALALGYADVIKRRDDGRKLVQYIKIGDSEDVYVSVRDVHHFFRPVSQDESITQMVIRYQDTRDTALFNKIAEKVCPLLTYIAKIGRENDKLFSLDEFVSAAFDGFLDCIESYDRSRAIKFETHLRKRVSGSILDYVREMDPATRLARTREKEYEKGIESICQKHGRRPYEDEPLLLSGLSPDEFGLTLASIRLAHPKTFDAPVCHANGRAESIDTVASFERYARNRSDPLVDKEFSEMIKAELRRFPDKVGLCFQLYLFEGLTMKEAGEEVGLSESRVCQLFNPKGRWVEKIRKALDLPSVNPHGVKVKKISL